MFYIIDGQVLELEIAPDKELYNYYELSLEQTKFYLEFPTASETEIKEMKLNQYLKPLESYLEDCTVAFKEKLNRGYIYKTYNLPLDEESRKVFSETLTLFTNSDEDPSTMIALTDSLGKDILIQLSDFKRCMAQYGAYYLKLWTSFQSYRGALS